ncbi:MAG: hypothetical protein IJA58_03435 [Lachnospiraceae bacterium]|nr:hypothetical protein [Lachnospiraceae bacterium]
MNRKSKLFPVIVGMIWLLGLEIGLETLFGRQQFMPLFLLSQIILLLGVSAIVLAIGGWLHRWYLNRPVVPEVDSDVVKGLESEDVPAGKKKRRGIRKKTAGSFWKKAGEAVVGFVCRKAGFIELLGLAAVFTAAHYRFYLAFRYYYMETVQVGYGVMALMLLVMFVCIVLDKWSLWTEKKLGETDEDRLIRATLHNLRIAFKIVRFCSMICALIVVLRIVGVWDAQRPLSYGFTAVWIYVSVFYVISLISRLIRRELPLYPRLSIPMPFAGRDEDDDMQILTHLEANTGITFRSLWSLHYIQKALPYTVFGALLVFWLATGLVQVNANEMGVRYRFGRLSESGLLKPGLHLTLPWPFDKTEIYDVGSVREIVIGYDSDRQQDNLWTEAHGNNEYRLLLGEGNELVSVNLRLKYVIDDLWEYVTVSADPAKILSAEAYELITNRIISTDLNELLSQDRAQLSNELHDSLNTELEKEGIGLSVVQVIVENIHPPVDVATVYQQLVTAEIQAQEMILEAEATAAETIANAQSRYNVDVQYAWELHYSNVADAKAEVTEFMAAVAADNSYSNAYRYYKYLNALKESLKDSKLYLLGSDIDAESLFFGGNYIIVNGGNSK